MQQIIIKIKFLYWTNLVFKIRNLMWNTTVQELWESRFQK